MGRNVTPPPAPVVPVLPPANNYLYASASRFAININDLLYLNGQGYVFPAQSTAWIGSAAANNAGGVLIADTIPGGSNANSNFDVMASTWMNPADKSIFNMSISSGTTLTKYDATGKLVRQVTLDGLGNGSSMQVFPLPNGNICAVWSNNGSQAWFAIFDTDLTQIVANTAVLVGSWSGSSTWVHAIPLSGGGFAFSVFNGSTNQPWFGIFSNAGAVVSALAVVAGSGTGTGSMRLAELSNGNIAMAVTNPGSTKALGIVIFNTSGGAVVAYNTIDTSAGIASYSPGISAMPGYFAASVDTSAGNVKVYVISNAGVPQGSVALTVVTGSGSFPKARVKNDGSNFWILTCDPGGTQGRLTRLTSAAVAVQSVFPVASSFTETDFFVERDLISTIVGGTSGKIDTFSIRTNGTVGLISSVATPTAMPASSNVTANLQYSPSGDFTALAVSQSDGTVAAKFRVWRYLDVALAGVSQTAVGAGNTGNTVTIAVGPASSPVNAIPGPSSLSFDNSGGHIVGNKGTIMNKGIIMKGF